MRHGMKRSLFISTHLENQLVRVDAIRQEEGRAQVPLQLRYFLDKGQQLRVNGFLVLLPLLCQLEFLYVKKTNESVAFNPKAHFKYSKNSEYMYIYILPLFLYQRFLPPGDGASSASSSWSRHRWGFWGSSYQRCQFWCLWQSQTSGGPCARGLCSGQEGLCKGNKDYKSLKDAQHLFCNLIYYRFYCHVHNCEVMTVFKEEKNPSLPVTSRRPLESCFRKTTRWNKKCNLSIKELRINITASIAPYILCQHE